MNKTTKRVLFWTPRIVCILFAIFISLFAVDVFSAGYSLPKTILALLMHLIPTGVIVIVLIEKGSEGSKHGKEASEARGQGTKQGGGPR
jgi:hypothetical protein